LDWLSKKQPIIGLSTTEVELISYTERVQATWFISQLLNELIAEEPTAVILEDITGCIFLIRNQKTGSRTKHIAVRYLYVRQCVQVKEAVPYFVWSAENYSVGMTKNLPDKLYKEHASVLTERHLAYRRADDVRKAIESMESNDSTGFNYGIPHAHSGATGEQGPKKGPMSEAKAVRFAIQEQAEPVGSPMRSK
jgi:hypothetical protein